MRFVEILWEAFFIIKKEPKLFLPKLFIALLFGVEMLAFAFLWQLIPNPFTALNILSPKTLEQLHALRMLLPYYFILLIYSFAVLLLDILINAMYPSMVQDYKQRSTISFQNAFRHSIKRMHIVLPIILATAFIAMLPLYFFLSFLSQSQDTVSFLIVLTCFLALYFALFVAFYLLYPVSVLEEKGPFSTVRRSLYLSRKNLRNISYASILPMALSLASFGLSFYVFCPFFLFLFIALRFLVAMIYTYHMVLDPSIYLIVRSFK